MKTNAEPPFVAATLKWCNDRRKEQGKEPLEHLPKGRRNDGATCPCGAATGFHVGEYDYFRIVNAFSRQCVGELPELVQEFVKEFDGGWLPQYEINE